MSTIDTDTFSGDVIVGHNLNVGGDETLSGSIVVNHDVTVKGWLSAANIKGTNRGVYKTAASLPSNPQEGWCAGVGDQSPFKLYMVVDGKWVDTGNEYVVEKGDTGATGDNGKSAYDIAKEQGYEGTEEEWLASLKVTIEKQTEDEDHNITIVWSDGSETFIKAGVTGEKGEQGDKGDKGDKGDTGAAGGVLYPTFSISGDDGHLYCYVPTTEADISAKLVDGHLILTVA